MARLGFLTYEVTTSATDPEFLLVAGSCPQFEYLVQQMYPSFVVPTHSDRRWHYAFSPDGGTFFGCAGAVWGARRNPLLSSKQTAIPPEVIPKIMLATTWVAAGGQEASRRAVCAQDNLPSLRLMLRLGMHATPRRGRWVYAAASHRQVEGGLPEEVAGRDEILRLSQAPETIKKAAAVRALARRWLAENGDRQAAALLPRLRLLGGTPVPCSVVMAPDTLVG